MSSLESEVVPPAVRLALPGVLSWLLAQATPPPLPPLPPGLGLVRSATVLSVRNGQELRVQMAGSELPKRVRLACVQAPRPGQVPWAAQARQQLSEALPPGSAVSLELRGVDDFNRTVALVRRKGRDVAIPLLENGAVFHYEGTTGSCANLSYRAVEGMARGRSVGVWSVPGGIERPWLLLQRQADPSDEP